MGGFDYKVPETVSKVIFSGEVMPPMIETKHMALTAQVQVVILRSTR